MTKLKQEIVMKSGNFLLEMSKELMGNKSAGKRARKLSLELEKLLKTYRGMSTGRIKA